jgi:uncharacterized protein GlcG (DUF336 family)
MERTSHLPDRDPRPPIGDAEVRALLNIVLDLAEDFGVACAVVVLDERGEIRAAERPAVAAPTALRAALDAARAACSARGAAIDGDAAAVPLLIDGRARGVLAIAGGPAGFAATACREAAAALGLATDRASA